VRQERLAQRTAPRPTPWNGWPRGVTRKSPPPHAPVGRGQQKVVDAQCPHTSKVTVVDPPAGPCQGGVIPAKVLRFAHFPRSFALCRIKRFASPNSDNALRLAAGPNRCLPQIVMPKHRHFKSWFAFAVSGSLGPSTQGAWHIEWSSKVTSVDRGWRIVYDPPPRATARRCTCCNTAHQRGKGPFFMFGAAAHRPGRATEMRYDPARQLR